MGKLWIQESAAQKISTPHHTNGPLLGKILLRHNAISNDRLMRALVLQQHQRARLGQILISEGWASRRKVLQALSDQHQLPVVTLQGRQMNRRLMARRPARFWLAQCAVPWMRLGDTVIMAVAHPEDRHRLETELAVSFPKIRFVLADEDEIRSAIAQHFRTELAHGASARPPSRLSCRSLMSRNLQFGLCGALAMIAVMACVFPIAALPWATLAAVTCLGLFMSMKLVGLLSYILPKPRSETPAHSAKQGLRRLPHISVMIPMYKEAEISRDLLRRLGKLSYPRTLLEIFLVLEDSDEITRAAVARVELPSWIRVIEVPANGGLKTKPRAMNYALDFCRGDLIGVWDAEDAPEGDQLEKVAEAFATSGPKVACMQGVLDYYNPTANWLSRCFTLEYSGWFRIVLPALSRLGLVLPLGGTTMFIRRNVLLEVGGWDAHNVTEDADLGVRLYRAGYETRMLPSTTFEEANCRAWPWIKQRSRWLKGFMITYLVHMRAPRQLLRDLGWWRVLGLQAFFVGTVGQFLLAPLLWTYWMWWMGLGHPISQTLSPTLQSVLLWFLLSCEVLSIALGIAAAFAGKRPWLALMAPTFLFYYPLGTFAAYKALYELVLYPFYWDKTQHGLHSDLPKPKVTLTSATSQNPKLSVSRAGPRPVLDGSQKPPKYAL